MPTNKALQGQNFMALKDVNGVFLIKDLIEAAKKGGGLVKYNFPKVKDGKPLPKFSYALSFEPYNWMIGTGVYVDDVDKEVEKLQNSIDDNTASQIQSFLLISVVLLLLSLGVTLSVSYTHLTLPTTERV